MVMALLCAHAAKPTHAAEPATPWPTHALQPHHRHHAPATLRCAHLANLLFMAWCERQPDMPLGRLGQIGCMAMLGGTIAVPATGVLNIFTMDMGKAGTWLGLGLGLGLDLHDGHGQGRCRAAALRRRAWCTRMGDWRQTHGCMEMHGLGTWSVHGVCMDVQWCVYIYIYADGSAMLSALLDAAGAFAAIGFFRVYDGLRLRYGWSGVLLLLAGLSAWTIVCEGALLTRDLFKFRSGYVVNPVRTRGSLPLRYQTDSWAIKEMDR